MITLLNKIKNELIRFKNRLFPPPPIQKTYYSEEQLLEGMNPSKSKKQSVIVFTTFKSASTFISKFLKTITEETDYLSANFDAYFTLEKKMRFNKWFDDKNFLKTAFHSKGYIYGPFRAFINTPKTDEYKFLLFLRDPRDVLISYYYSIAYSHPIVIDIMSKLREDALNSSIDEHVLKTSDFLLKVYTDYKKLSEENEVIYLKYSDMIADPQKFLNNIQNSLGIKLKKETINKILVEELQSPKQEEDIYAHRRSGKTGQYKDKLKPETIEILNEKFKDVIQYFELDT